MGVPECSRVGCPSTFPERYHAQHNVSLCDDCFEELVASGPLTDIQEFSKTPKISDQAKEAARARFEIELPKERDD